MGNYFTDNAAPDEALDRYNDPNLTQRQRVGLDPLPGEQGYGKTYGGPTGAPRITVSPPKTGNYFTDNYSPPHDEGITGGQAFAAGLSQGGTFGLAPALVGLAQAGRANPAALPMPAGVASEAPGMEEIGAGLAHLSTPEGRAAYEAGRADAMRAVQSAEQQHPIAAGAGMVGGALLTPGFGAGMGGSLGARLAAGAAGGAIGGGAYGAGSAISEGAPASEIAASAARGSAVGGVLGGSLNAALGSRAVSSALSGPAQTAEAIGAPLPRGVASNSRAINSLTSAAASIPIFGARIRNAVSATREAAGDVIGQSGVDEAIASNRGAINNLYNTVRNSIKPDEVMPMPQTASAVAAVKARRAAARQANPSQGLEQFENIGEQGASFNGAHRARVDARDAGDALSPHPGYNAADYNQITKAMTGDMRVNLFRQGGQEALNAFDKAEKNFGPISEANRFLARVARQRGPGAGLDEIGFNPSTGEFSLDKFVTAWNKINPQTRPFVPEPAQRANINAVFEMGQHIKGAMRERNTSHTATPLIMWDLARDAIMTGAAVAGGIVSGVSVLGSAAAAMPAVVFAHWLSSPAKAASMARWSRAYTAWRTTADVARTAQLRIATRNLANTLGLPMQQVLEHLSGAAPSRADQGADNQ